MNWPYLHILINHFPIILMVVGSAALLPALIGNRRSTWLYALATLTLAGISIYPAYYTGDAASHAMRGTWYVVRSMVSEHDDAAGYALFTVLAAGLVSAYAWWKMLRHDAPAAPPGWMKVVVTVLALFALSVVVRTAYLGGKIVHESPKLVNPPPGTTSASPSTLRSHGNQAG
jgi:hypothetical protein